MSKISELPYLPLGQSSTQAKKDEPGNFSRGFKKAMYQLPQTFGGSVGLLGDSLGLEGMREYGMGIYDKNTKKVEDLTKESDSLTSVMEGDGSFSDWLASGTGYVAGQVLSAAATGGVGGFIGKQIASRGIKHIVADQIEKQVKEKILAKGMKAGAATGLFGSNLMQEAGSIYPEALAEAQKNGVELTGSDKARIFGSALAAAGVDTAMEGVMVNKVLGGGRRVITNAAGESANQSMVRAAMREVPLGMTREGVTEGIQTGIERYGANQELGSKEAMRDYVDSASVGMLGGAAGGGASSFVKQKLPETGVLTRAANAGIDAENAPQLPAPTSVVANDGQRYSGMDAIISAVQHGNDPSLERQITQAQVRNNLDVPNELEGAPKNFAEVLAQSNQRRAQTKLDNRNAWEDQKEQHIAEQLEQEKIAQAQRLRLPAPDMPMPDGALISDNGVIRPETYADAASAANAASLREELGQSIPHGDRGGIENVRVPVRQDAPTMDYDSIPTLIFNTQGKPFTTKIGAETKVRQLGEHFSIYPMGGGYVIQNNHPDSKNGVPPSPPESKNETISNPALATETASNMVQDGDIMHPSGKPFTVKVPALKIQKEHGGEVIKVEGGYIVRPAAPVAEADLLSPPTKDTDATPTLEQAVASEQAAPNYTKGKTGAETARNKLAVENPFLSLLAKYGVHIDERSDVGGEHGKARLVPGHGPLFRKNGLRLDELAQMAQEQGFLSAAQMEDDADNGGVNALSEMIRKALNSEVIKPIQDEPQLNSADAALLEEAHAIGIDTTGKTGDQVYDLVKEYHDEKDYQEAIDLLNELSEESKDSSQEYNLQELVFDIEDLKNAEENSTRSERAPSQTESAGTRQTESGSASIAETATEQAQTSDGSGGDQDFGLTSETTQEANARIEQEEARAKEKEAESTKQEDADRKARIKKEIDSRQESSAENFQLGQNAEDSLSGQGDIFSEKSEVKSPLVQDQKAKLAAPIADFGEKIGGAKKDVWSGFKDKMDAAKALDIASEPLSKSWPEPDYQALLDNGADSWAVGFMHAARDAVPRKPTKSYKLKSWADGVKTLRNFAADIADGTISTEKVKAEMQILAGKYSPFHWDDLLTRIELYLAVGHSKSLVDIRLSSGEYNMLNGVLYNPAQLIWTVEKKAAATAFSNFPQHLAQGDTKEAAIEDFKAKFANMEITKPANKEISFDVFSERGKPGFYVGKKVGRNYIKLAGPFDTVKEARSHKSENQDALVAQLEKSKEIPSERRDTNNPRVGEDMREGKDVTPEMFSNAFGFRGVEFGNYVEQGKRQSDLNEAYDALMDMAALLGIPSKSISLNGTLGLAFGARGSGGKQAAAAHYESNKVVINLTKKSGAGSLGHEWWHALDNYFSRMANKPGDFMTDRLDVNLSGKGSNYVYRNEGVRKEMIDAFGAVMKAIRSTAIKARSSKLDGKRTKEYWTTDVEMSARAFESYLISKLQDNNASNDYLANIVDPETWAASEQLGFELDSSYPYPTAGEIPAIRAGFDHFFSVIESKDTAQGIALFSRDVGQRSRFGFDVDELRPIIDSIKAGWKNAPKINIVQTVDDLPFDSPSDVRGAYYKKQVYLVAANLRNAEQAQAVLFHEALGHAGLSEFFGDDLAPALRSIGMKNRSIAHAANTWRKQNLDIKGEMSDDKYYLKSIEEALADYAGTGRVIKGIERLIAAIQRGLRAIGLNSVADWMENATDAEVLSMLASARKKIVQGDEFNVFGEQQVQAFSREKGVFENKVIIGHPLGELSNHLDYVFAKAGDSESALNVVDDLVNDGFIKKIKDAIGDDDVIVQPVFALERTGLNQIPLALAGKIAASLELKVGDKLFQSTSPKRTGLSGLDRIFNRPEFSGEVEKGKKYFLVDDTVTQGGTFFALKSYIESNGGEVVGFSTLTGKQYSATIELSKDTLRKIREKYSDIEPKFKAVTGYGFDSLTESEARYLANFEPTESIRNRIDDEYRSKNNPNGNGPLQQEVNPDALFSRSITTGDNSRTRTPEQLRAFENVGRTVQVPTLKERFNKLTENLGKKLAQGIVDQFAPIKDLSEEAYGLMRLSKGASGAFEAMLKGGQLKLSDGVYDFDETKRGGVVDRLLVPLQGEADDFMWWVAGNRADALSKQGKEHLFTSDDIKAFKSLTDGQTTFDYTIQHGLQKGKTTRDRAIIYADSLKTFNEFNKNTLDMAEQSGLIDPESRKIWESEFYIPFYRVSEESDDGVRGMNIKSGVVRQQAFKKLKGGTDKLNSDLLENTLMNWAHLLDAAAKNRAAKSTLEAAEKVGAATPAMSGDKKTVWYMDSGEKKYFAVEDAHLLVAIQGLEYAGMRSPIMNAMSMMKHAMTVGVTTSPFFKVRNLIRDSVSAIGIAGLDYNPGKNIKEGWKLTDPKSDEYFRLLAGGGTIHFGSMLEGSEAKRVRKLVESGVDESTILNSDTAMKSFYRKHVAPAVDAYNELGNRGESINRASLYDQLIKQGKSHAEASLMARDLMDFSMQGAWTSIRFLTQVVPFMNARLQGLYKLGKSAKEDPKRFGTVLGAVSVASIALMLAYSDDDDWKKREDWDRDNFWWFKIGGTAFRIPKPFEIGAIGTLAERGVEYFTQDEMTGERFISRFKHLMLDSLSMNPIPQMIKPVIDVYANKDSFTGRPIETMSMERLRSDYRFNGSTSMTARGLSTAGNALTGDSFLSPVQIDHLIRGYFGWLGTFVVGAADKVTRPLANEPTAATPDYLKVFSGGMVADTKSASSRYVTQMYDQAKVLDEAYGTWRMLIKTGKIEEAKQFADDNAEKLHRYKGLQNVKKQASSLNEQIRVIERSNLDSDEKRERINLIQQRKDNIARKASL